MKHLLSIILITITISKANCQNMENKTSSKTIVFIHGLFMNSTSWKPWIIFFEAKGYKCYAPDYPFHAGNPVDLRANVDPRLKKITLNDVIDTLSNFIDQLPEKPILIGHSMGGFAVQKLIELNKGVVGICIDPAPPKGIFSFKWSFLKINLSIINPFKGNSVFFPNLKWFHNAFCHTMSIQQAEIAYNQLVVPESRNIARSSTTKEGKIDFKKPHNPLLIIAGENDQIIPSSLNKKNFEAYKDTNSKIDFKEFSGRTHLICNQENWDEVAIYIFDWITSLNR